LEGRAALAHGLVHDDCSGYGDVEGRDLSGHGDSEEVVAGLFDEVVEAGSFAAEDEDAVGAEVEVHVVGGAALVEAEDPDVFLLELLEGADEIGDAGYADVFGGSGGGLGNGSGDGGGAAFGEDDAVDTGSVGGAKKGPEVVGVFDAVEGEEEVVLAVGFGGEEIFDGEELALADDGDDSLMGVGAGEAGELVAGLDGDADFCGSAEFDEAFEAVVAAFAGYADVIELAGAGADGLLDWVEAVENFHDFSLLPVGSREIGKRKR
jgi:hypothetical protein